MGYGSGLQQPELDTHLFSFILGFAVESDFELFSSFFALHASAWNDGNYYYYYFFFLRKLNKQIWSNILKGQGTFESWKVTPT